MKAKTILKSLLPPLVISLFKKRRTKYGWFGNYSKWEDAQKECSGYDATIILENCKNALLEVKNGKAVYERDSVLFNTIEYSWPLLAGLMFIAAINNGNLQVLDFGGSLGSSYFQNRKYLLGLKNFCWRIVEQSNFVKCGKEMFENETLKFYENIKASVADTPPNVILLSSVLSYLQEPYKILDEIIQINAQSIIIDRTIFIEEPEDRLAIQKVSPTIFKATLACWFFSKNKLIEYFNHNNYLLHSNFKAIDQSCDNFEFCGYIFLKKGI